MLLEKKVPAVFKTEGDEERELSPPLEAPVDAGLKQVLQRGSPNRPA